LRFKKISSMFSIVAKSSGQATRIRSIGCLKPVSVPPKFIGQVREE